MIVLLYGFNIFIVTFGTQLPETHFPQTKSPNFRLYTCFNYQMINFRKNNELMIFLKTLSNYLIYCTNNNNELRKKFRKLLHMFIFNRSNVIEINKILIHIEMK